MSGPEHVIEAIERWCNEKGFIDPDKQLLKALEELGELSRVHVRASGGDINIPALMSEVGDVVVTLIAYCSVVGLDFTSCIEMAHTKIAGRSGELRDGVFVRDGDPLG